MNMKNKMKWRLRMYWRYSLKENPFFYLLFFLIGLFCIFIIVPYYIYHNPLWFVNEQIKIALVVLLFYVGFIIPLSSIK